MPFDACFEEDEDRTGVAGERAAEECAEDLLDDGFEASDLFEALCGLSSDGVFESGGVDCIE